MNSVAVRLCAHVREVDVRGLVLAQQDRPEEAAHLGTLAIESGRLVPSNIWRVAELDRVLVGRHDSVAEAQEFHEGWQVFAKKRGKAPWGARSET